MNGAVPARANDLSQSLSVILICLVDLHLKGSARMPGIKTDNFESEIAELMNKPRRHRSSLDPYKDIVSRVPKHGAVDLIRNRGALTPP